MGTITNQRDKMVLIALFVLGLGCLIGLFFQVDTKEALFTIVGAFAMAFKGNPSQPATGVTETTTVSTEKEEEEKVN